MKWNAWMYHYINILIHFLFIVNLKIEKKIEKKSIEEDKAK